MKSNGGLTFVSLLIAVFVLAAGITALLKVYPVIGNLSQRAKSSVSVSLIADRLFSLIENVYGHAGGPPVPAGISGRDEEFPAFFYRALMKEEKEDLYSVEIEISWKREGNEEKEIFQGKFRRK